MKERPILFSGPMVQAILKGRKTQTRRVAKDMNPAYLAQYADDPKIGQFCKCGQLGDRLWVRETWAPVSPHEDREELRGCLIEYRADTPGATRAGGWDAAPDDAEAIRWRPSIFMPRWASRITLEITDVRIQRVQEISEADASAEGMTAVEPGEIFFDFMKLWDKLNAKRGYGWDTNPFVWCLSFKRIENTNACLPSGSP